MAMAFIRGHFLLLGIYGKARTLIGGIFFEQ